MPPNQAAEHITCFPLHLSGTRNLESTSGARLTGGENRPYLRPRVRVPVSAWGRDNTHRLCAFVALMLSARCEGADEGLLVMIFVREMELCCVQRWRRMCQMQGAQEGNGLVLPGS
jgi:hypothetical protein